jgi:opacity protein-like surface antigen
MKSKKTQLWIAFSMLFCLFIVLGASPDQGQTKGVTVKVNVRFARIRILPAADAKILKQIGYGTMFQVVGKNGEYFQVVPLTAAPAAAGQAWYIHQGEVEMLSDQQLLPNQEKRLVKFEPQRPVAGQPVLFTALNFRTPNLLKWDMGDGTVLTSGSKSSQVQEARLAYAYTAAGTYDVKVYDDQGNLSLAPLTLRVPVAAYPRSLQINPERPLANHPVTISAVNFDTPQGIAWDLGDGSGINPGDKSGVVKANFVVTHIYTSAGTYTIKAWDSSGDKRLPPLSISIQVAADPALVKIEPVKAEPIPVDIRPVQNIPNIVVLNPEAAQTVEPNPAPVRARNNLAFKIGPYAGFFQPRDANLKTIYGDGDVIYGGKLGIHIWQGFYFWVSASQFKVIAQTTFSEDKTTLTLTPFSAFLRGSLHLGFFNPYVGIGFTYMSFKEESEIGNTTGNGSNTAYEAGFELKMNRHFIMDFSFRYDLIKVNPTGFPIDLGGLQAGVSLLVSF